METKRVANCRPGKGINCLNLKFASQTRNAHRTRESERKGKSCCKAVENLAKFTVRVEYQEPGNGDRGRRHPRASVTMEQGALPSGTRGSASCGARSGGNQAALPTLMPGPMVEVSTTRRM